MQLLADYCKNHKASGDRAMMNIINRKFPGAKYLTPQSERLVDCLLETAGLSLDDKTENLGKIPGIVQELCEAYAEWGFTVTKKQREELVALCEEYYDNKYAQFNWTRRDGQYKALWSPENGYAELPDIPNLPANEQQHYYFMMRAFQELTRVNCSFLKTQVGKDLKLRLCAMLKDAGGHTDALPVISESCLHKALQTLSQWPVLDKSAAGDEIDAKWQFCHMALAEVFAEDLIARYPLHGVCCHDAVIDVLKDKVKDGQNFEDFIKRNLSRYKDELDG